jgi:hypothetical protein
MHTISAASAELFAEQKGEHALGRGAAEEESADGCCEETLPVGEACILKAAMRSGADGMLPDA